MLNATSSSFVPWWKGRRGEWYVLAQAALIMLVANGPRTPAGLPPWPAGLDWLWSVAGAVLMAGGFLWILAGGAGLGASLTPLPYPKDTSKLVDTGAYALVRHPMYCGAIWLAFGWALWVQGLFTLAYAVLLFAFADIKASREERWLRAKFPEYAGYQKRVRKLIPFVY